MLERTDITPTAVQIDSGTATVDWKPLNLFNLYRLTIAIAFVSFVLADVSPSFLGQFDPRLFLVTCWLYSGFGVLCIFTIEQKWPPFHVQVLGQILVDIFVITVLMHASGGVNSGLGMLLVVTIAGGSLLTEGRIAFFLAAVASLCVQVQVALADIYYWFAYANYTHAGMLGASFFATAFLAHALARRVRSSEALAKQRGVYLQYLAQLNAQIVQNIQSGIVVIDIVGRIRLFNEAARRLLGLNEQPNGRTLTSVAPKLAEQVTNWQKSGKATSPLFRPVAGEVDVIATFTELNRGEAISVLIMLEDATLTAQRAQQLKLASLGRLTASIAHEIRNPLGAISHAGQLLAESPHISQEDARLTQIIADNSQRMNTIIENVLQLSRRGQPNTQCFDLHTWLQSFIDEFIIQQDLTASDVVLHPNHPSITVCFDPEQLYQVMSNLCENGLRYSQGTPLLELSIGVGADTGRPFLDVRDQGQGMTSAVKAQIFEPFFTTESKGTGLGLYIAREICEANQASMHLLSNSSAGCCFRIHFSSGDQFSVFSDQFLVISDQFSVISFQ
jgi:two-component system sensor histidine kinase PilS (NtrC family)